MTGKKSLKLLGYGLFLNVILLTIGRGAYAEDDPALDEDERAALASDRAAQAAAVSAPTRVQWGVGLRTRFVSIPKGLIELFVEQAPSGVSSFGIGLEGIRRRGNFEITVGVEFESLETDEGVYIENGDMIPADEVDLVEFDNFSWVTADVSFVWHKPVGEKFAFRYGAGLGLGIVLGKVLQTDYQCSGGSVDTCLEKPMAENVRKESSSVPPVVPVINVIVGAQIRPIKNLAINLEGGLRTALYLGATTSYYF